MEMDVTARRHGDATRLEGEPLAPSDAHRIVIDRGAEHAAGKHDLSGGQRALTAGGTGFDNRRGRFVQRSSPAARTSTGKLCLSPPATVSVTSVVSPGESVSATSKAMT